MAEVIADTEISSPAGFRRGRIVGIVSILTVLVAIAGYIREAALAARFGVSATMDAYFGAIFIPNSLYLVLIAGTLSPIFIPILLQEGAENPAKASEIFSHITNFVLLLLTVAVAVSMLTIHYWMPMLFSGFTPGTTRLAIHLTFIVLPAVLFLAIAGILTAVLNGFHKFRLAACAPALASLAVIAAVLFARDERAIYVVAFATALGFLLQCLVLVPAARSLGIRYRFELNLRHPAIAKLLRLGIPLFIYLAIGNASLFVERNLASHVSTGAIAVLSYALRLFMVPANFLVAPLATVVYPQFVLEAGQERSGNLSAQVSRVFRIVVFLFLPITVWMIVNALPVTRLLYEHGNFTAADSQITSQVAAIFAAAILPYAVAVVGLRCYFALEDTITPMLAELTNLAFYVGAAGILARHYGLIGLAVSRMIVFFLVSAILMTVLSKRLGLLKISLNFLGFLARTAVASAIMGAFSWIILHVLRSFSGSVAGRLGVIALSCILSGAIFLGIAMLLRITEARHLWGTLLDLTRPTPASAAPE